jgi:hypothetical protein
MVVSRLFGLTENKVYNYKNDIGAGVVQKSALRAMKRFIPLVKNQPTNKTVCA